MLRLFLDPHTLEQKNNHNNDLGLSTYVMIRQNSNSLIRSYNSYFGASMPKK